MNQRAFNNRIALSLLRQCAWVWEHCIKYNDSKKEPEGEFTMKDVRMGLSLRDFKKSPIGWIDVKLDLCPYWHLFAQQGKRGGCS